MVKLPPSITKPFNQNLKEQLAMRITKIWDLFLGLVNLVSLFQITIVYRNKNKASLSRLVNFLSLIKLAKTSVSKLNNFSNLHSIVHLCYCSRICNLCSIVNLCYCSRIRKQFLRLFNQNSACVLFSLLTKIWPGIFFFDPALLRNLGHHNRLTYERCFKSWHLAECWFIINKQK